MADDDSIESLFACQAENEAERAPQIISRADAIALGFVTYFTGKPCKNDHISERYVKNGCCIACAGLKLQNWRKNNSEKRKKQSDKDREQNKTKAKLWNKVWQAANRPKVNAKRKLNKENNINFKLGLNLRVRLYGAIKNSPKSGSAVRDLGCSVEFLKQRLEVQFQNDMTWENWGTVWEIDHIEPLCSFDLTDREQLLKACHYTNLRPLMKLDNRRKIAEDVKKKLTLFTNELQALFEDENPAKE